MPPISYPIVLFAFSGWPFVWREINYLKLAAYFLPLIVAVMFFMSKKKIRLNIFIVTLFLLLMLALLSTGLSVHEEIRSKVLTRAILYLFLITAGIAMSSISFEELAKAVNVIIRLYVIISLPSILIFLAYLSGIDLPYWGISLSGRGNLYQLYPFGVITEHSIFDSHGDWRIVRINGFSEEPGILGTYVVFLLILNKYIGYERGKGIINASLHVLGFLSFSLFYYVSVMIFVLGGVSEWLFRNIKVFFTGMIRMPEWVFIRKGLLVLLVGTGIYLFIKPGNPMYYLINTRIYHPELGLLAGNSRSQYDERMFEYLQGADVSRIMIGFGPGSNSLDENAGYASWAADVYDGGILSVVVVGFMFLCVAIRYLFVGGRLSIGAFFIILPAMLSYYQRPEIMSPIIVIFWIVIARYPGEIAYVRGLTRNEQGGCKRFCTRIP